MDLEMGRELCRLLDAALHGRKPDRMPGPEKMQELLKFADRHSLLPLLYGTIGEDIKAKSRQTVQQSYHLLFLSRYVVRTLADSGIPSMVLKGCAAAEYYPCRSCGSRGMLICFWRMKRQWKLRAGVWKHRASDGQRYSMRIIIWSA